ncbi:hypothetical protein BV22DRAFT_187290 [Leucogyrophana mollusca]|uniref:Uncharacterized protein n=1 Tax=Leucogyrophana mollusca TaxID=85980 RepID=A0ACB8BTU1_9AGAM|nr:hypothetical protein BV22DRAFT_187290 [Leucogyrophana mollusca]
MPNRSPLAPLDPNQFLGDSLKYPPTPALFKRVGVSTLNTNRPRGSPRSPLRYHAQRVYTHSNAAKCSSPEQEDVDEILHFLFRISHFAAFVLRIFLCAVQSVFHATTATLQWLIVVFALIELTRRLASPLVSNFVESGFFTPLGGGFIRAGGALYYPDPTAFSPTPSLPSTTEAATATFITEQIHHATNILALVEGMGLPSSTLFDEHIWNVERFISKTRPSAADAAALSDIGIGGLDTVLLNDFSVHGFIGKTLSHALGEIQHISSQGHLRYPPAMPPGRDAHLASVLSLTASNLLLEYSSVLSLTETILPRIESTHHVLADALRTHDDVISSEHGWRKKLRRRLPTGSNKRLAADVRSTRAFVAGLDIIQENMRRLKTYLEWSTEQLVSHYWFSGSLTFLTTRQSRSSLITNLSSDKTRTSRPVDEGAIALTALFARSEAAQRSLCGCCCCDEELPVVRINPWKVEVSPPSSPTVMG